MVKIEFLGPISAVMQNSEIQADTLTDVISYIKSKDELKEWRDDLALALNDEIIRETSNKTITLKDGDKISVLPPVCGG